MLIDKQECTGLNSFNDLKAFIGYSNYMDDIYKKIEECNLDEKRKNNACIWYDCHILGNKDLNPIVTELFTRDRKLNISLFFMTHFYFAVPKNI